MSVTVRAWKKKKGDCLYLDIYHDGQRKTENLHITLTGDPGVDGEKRRIAEIVRARRDLELLAGTHGLRASHTGEIALVEYVARVPTPAVIRSLEHLRLAVGTLQLRAFSRDHANHYQDYLTGRGLKRSTIETYINTLAARLNEAVREGIISGNPIHLIKRVRADETLPKSLTDDELRRLAETPIMGAKGLGGEIKRAFQFSCYTGLRWSDDQKLTYGKIRITKVKGKDGTQTIRRQVEATQIKTGEPVYVPLNTAAWSLIDPGDRIPSHDERVFPFLRAGTDTHQYTHPWGDAAGIPGLNFHRSRHTFPRFLLDQGVDLVTVQALMGHKKITTTARYGKASDRQKMDAVDRIG